jgi:hypothetical protein
MTETTELPAGREMDALVAERVMGYSYQKSKHGHWKVTGPNGVTSEPMYGAAKFDPETGEPIVDDWWCGVDLPDYSIDIAAAWRVVDRLNEIGWLVTVKQMPEGVPYIIDPEHTKVMSRVVVSLQWMQWMKDKSAETFRIGPTVVGDEAPATICRAALRAAQSPRATEGRGAS